MTQFTLLGIPVRIQPWFWLSLVLLGGGMGANTQEGLLRLALFVLAGFVSILVHELGHALAGRANGAHSAITLHAFGGLAEFEGAWFSRKQSFLVTLAGPAAQIALGGLVWLVVPEPFALRSLLGYFWWYLIFISVAWALLNLLPVLPMDGGQMLNALLGPERIRITLWTSIVTAVVAGLAMFKFTGSIYFPLLLALFAFQAWRSLQEESWRR